MYVVCGGGAVGLGESIFMVLGRGAFRVTR